MTSIPGYTQKHRKEHSEESCWGSSATRSTSCSCRGSVPISSSPRQRSLPHQQGIDHIWMKRVSAIPEDSKVHGGEKQTKLLGKEIHRVMRRRTLTSNPGPGAESRPVVDRNGRLCMLTAQSLPFMKCIRLSKPPFLIASKTGKPSSWRCTLTDSKWPF